jgi:hypothetical protein
LTDFSVAASNKTTAALFQCRRLLKIVDQATAAVRGHLQAALAQAVANFRRGTICLALWISTWPVHRSSDTIGAIAAAAD